MYREERATKIEEAILIMKDLLVNHDERMEDYYKALQESRRAMQESREDFNLR